MNEEEDFFAESKTVLESYIQDRILLLKLQSVEKISVLVSLMFMGLLMALLSFFVLLFISIMAGYYFASLTGSMFAGFGIVASFYIILLILLATLGKKYLTVFITNLVIKIFFDQNADDNDTR
ncbi:MAG TPA: hypothetical protein PLA68_08410 [Panacibacter sp.]|nr:hypothetical protein [Panacibacter sp.]